LPFHSFLQAWDQSPGHQRKQGSITSYGAALKHHSKGRRKKHLRINHLQKIPAGKQTAFNVKGHKSWSHSLTLREHHRTYHVLLAVRSHGTSRGRQVLQVLPSFLSTRMATLHPVVRFNMQLVIVARATLCSNRQDARKALHANTATSQTTRP